MKMQQSLFSLVLIMTLTLCNCEWFDCTPPDQTDVTCLVSADCGMTDAVRERIPVIRRPVLRQTIFWNDTAVRTGVNISWTAGDLINLSKTNGFVLRIYHGLGSSKMAEMCRYFNVSVNNNVTENVEFTYHVPALSGTGTRYTLEVTSLPHSAYEGDKVASNSFTTHWQAPVITTTAAPRTIAIEEFKVNASVVTAGPYSATVRFRQTTYYINVSAHYKILYYSVLLINEPERNIGSTQTINDSKTKIEIWTNTSIDSEYAEVTFTGIIPGTYGIMVTFKRNEKQCSPFPPCGIVSERSLGQTVYFNVSGEDYTPPFSPTLNISTANDITINFYMAPSNMYIEKYDVVISKPNPGSNAYSEQIQSVPSTVWLSYPILIGSTDILKHFNYGESIQVSIIPTLNRRICNNRGHCNLSRDPLTDCSPCTPSVSSVVKLKLKIEKSSAAPSSGSQESNMWVTPVIVITCVLVIVIIIVSVVYVARGKLPIKKLFNCCTDRDYSKPEASFPDTVTLKTSKSLSHGDLPAISVHPRVRVCLAYTPNDSYKELKDQLRNVLENFFWCQVDLYIGDGEPDMVYGQYDFVMVLYSWPLLEAFLFFESLSRLEAPKEFLQRKRVLDFVLNPPPVTSAKVPTIILATFDHVPLRDLNQILSRNTELKVFKLPTEVESLATHVNPQAKETWAVFEESKMKRDLDKAIQEVAKYDSGFESITLLSVETSNPALNDNNSEEPHGYSNQNADRTVTMGTTTPRAPENKYFTARQDSVDDTLGSGSAAVYTPSPNHASGLDPSYTPMERVVSRGVRPDSAARHIIIDEHQNDRRESQRSSKRESKRNSSATASPGDNECMSVAPSEDSFTLSTVNSSYFQSQVVDC